MKKAINKEKLKDFIYMNSVQEMTSNSEEYFKNEALKYISEIFNEPLKNIEYNTHIWSVYKAQENQINSSERLSGWKQYVELMKGVYGIKTEDKKNKKDKREKNIS